jgi:hypothetical protein
MATFQNTFVRAKVTGQPAPNNNLSAVDYNGNTFGSNAIALTDTSGASTLTASVTLTSIANGVSKKGMAAQCVSPLLAAQSISAANWAIGFAAQYASAAANKTWNGWAALYLVNGSTGAIRTTIFGVTAIGSTARTATTYTTCYNASVAGSSATASDGDYLVLELGVQIDNTSGSTLSNQAATVRYANSTTISSDAATNTTPKSFLNAPAALTIYIPPVTVSGSGTAQSATGSGTGITHRWALSGTGTAQSATGSGTGITHRNTLSGSATAQGATGTGTGVTHRNTLSGSATAQGATGTGTGIGHRWALSGNGSAQAATGTGTGITHRNTLSGSATAQDATGTGTGITHRNTLSGSASAQGATGTGTGVQFIAIRTLSGSGSAQAATGTGTGITHRNTLSGSASAQAATGTGTGIGHRWALSGSATA